MSWSRLNIVVEGHTEEEFVKEILKPHFSNYSISVSVRMVANRQSRQRKYKGGLLKFSSLQRDVCMWMREDQAATTRFTTMVDLYGYPSDAPLYDEACTLSPYEKVKLLEQGLEESLDDGSKRFIPYIQLHEFETLLYADLSKWQAYFPGKQIALNNLTQSVASFSNIEIINDSRATAPSKRILEHLPEYDKIVAGVVLATAIGLPVIRKKCVHFDGWLSRLEQHQVSRPYSN